MCRVLKSAGAVVTPVPSAAGISRSALWDVLSTTTLSPQSMRERSCPVHSLLALISSTPYRAIGSLPAASGSLLVLIAIIPVLIGL
ncbi:MAG: hypothetical protein LBP19_04750 [Treponema sp.]|nr:hypothetical protein [Treponema sp.]